MKTDRDRLVIILLCLCVFFQMLGVPAPLLDAGASLEVNASSIQEGWSIQVRYVLLPPAFRFTSIIDAGALPNVPILAGALFRPPLG